MQMLKNKFDVELNLFDYFQYYQYFREKLINKNYDLNSEKWIKKSLLVTKNKNIHMDFKIFTHKLLSTPFKEKQNNNHFFLRTLLAEKNEQYLRVSYSALYKKLENLNIEEIKIGDQNISAKNIYSNKILTNETESLLQVNKLENEFIKFIRKQEIKKLKPKIIFDFEEKILYIDDKEQIKFIQNIQDYVALQMIRNESIFLNLIELFKQYTDFENCTFFDYLFFKYIYNYSIKIHFKNMQEKLKDFNYVRVQNFLLPDFSPLKFCMNEFNTIRLSAFAPIEEYVECFAEEDYQELENIFISVARSNSFIFLSKIPLSNHVLEKINIFLRKAWNHICLSTTLRTFLIPINSQFLDVRFFKTQLNEEDYNRTMLLENLFEKADIFEKKIESLLPT